MVLVFLSAFVALILLRTIVFRLIKKRKSVIFEQEFIGFLSLLISEVKAGRGVLESFATVGEYLNPRGSLIVELRRFNQSLISGTPLALAIRGFARDLHPDLNLFRVAIILICEQGAAASPSLRRLRSFMKQRNSFRRRLSTSLAAQKLATIGMLISLSVLILMQFFSHPDALSQILKSSIGVLIFTGAILLILIGVVWMLKLASIKV